MRTARQIKIIAQLAFVILLFAQCSVQKGGTTPHRGSGKQADKLINEAKKLTGIKYKYAGKTPKSGFDCSGFTSYVFKKIDVNLSGSSSMQAQTGKKVDLKKVQKGDLLFFTGSNKKSKKVGHVSLVVDNKKGKIKMIHATTSKGVMIQTYNDSSYWTSRFLFARRILD